MIRDNFYIKEVTVITSRNDIHYVVVEYGVAELKGKALVMVN